MAVGNYRFSKELSNNPHTSEETEQKIYIFVEVFVTVSNSSHNYALAYLQPKSVLEIAAPSNVARPWRKA